MKKINTEHLLYSYIFTNAYSKVHYQMLFKAYDFYVKFW